MVEMKGIRKEKRDIWGNVIEPPSDNPESIGLKTIFLGGLILLIIVGIVILPQYLEQQTIIEYKAWEKAKELVKDKLKTPATAKFPPYSKDFVYNEGYGVWEISKSSYGVWLNETYNGTKFHIYGYVDAENDFGALIRSEFSVSIIRTDETGIYAFGNDGWAVEYVDIFDI